MVGLDMSSPYDRRRIGSILGELSEDEHRAGRPLISAVVVASGTAVPGGGFFELARRLGLLRAEDKDSFYIQELRRVHDYWSGSRGREGAMTSEDEL